MGHQQQQAQLFIGTFESEDYDKWVKSKRKIVRRCRGTEVNRINKKPKVCNKILSEGRWFYCRQCRRNLGADSPEEL